MPKRRSTLYHIGPGANLTGYKSNLRDWDEQATVRIKPRRLLFEEEAKGKVYFLPEGMPIIQHPIITRLGVDVIRYLTIQRLYLYLEFTEKLEHEVVNSVAKQIAQNDVGISLPKEMEFDAYKIYCDEAYHGLCSADLKRQVEDVSGIKVNLTKPPSFLRKLRNIQNLVPGRLRRLIEVFFVIISETLISATLAKIPGDERIVTAVRKVIGDHALDEARHHIYFSTFLRLLWPRLTDEQHKLIGPLLPHLLLGFLEPDYVVIKSWLTELRLKRGDVEAIIEETYPSSVVISSAVKAAGATLRLFDQVGILQDQSTMEAFYASGLFLSDEPVYRMS